MSSFDEEAAEHQYEEYQRVSRMVRPHLDRAAKVYDHAITSLWVGNAGATLATLSLMGSTWSKVGVLWTLLWPLSFFLAGVAAMAIGSIIALFSAKGRIERMSRSSTILDLPLDDIFSPAEEIGLTFADWRTRMAAVSGFLFIGGCVVGLFVLIRSQ